MTLKEFIETMPIMVETEGSNYHKTLHVVENKKFHDQLTLKVCEKLSRVVAEILEHAKKKGEINIDDTRAAALFCVYGQIGILLSKSYTAEEKEKCIRDFLIHALQL